MLQAAASVSVNDPAQDIQQGARCWRMADTMKMEFPNWLTGYDRSSPMAFVASIEAAVEAKRLEIKNTPAAIKTLQ